jgi:hypothetical protein
MEGFQTDRTAVPEASEQFPAYWSFDEHGLTLAGGYVRTDEGPTSYGQRAIVVFDVDGQERALWLTQKALIGQFADELARRQARNFAPGERITVTRGSEKKTSAGGHQYWPFRVVFHDAPSRDAAAIFRSASDSDAPAAAATASTQGDDDIPF